MVNQADLNALQREAEKQRAALAATSEKIATIEQEERRKREEQEQKQRDFASLERKLKACRDWIQFVENKISELKGLAAELADAACSVESGEFLHRLRDNLTEVAAWERELAAFKEYESASQAKIKAAAL